VGIREDKNTTITRFLSGLSLKIRYRVELLPYTNLNNLVQLCINVEQQNLRKSLSKKGKAHSSNEYSQEKNNFVEKQIIEPSNNINKI